MKAEELYRQLDADFIRPEIRDDWSFMQLHEGISEPFRSRWMGRMLDHASEIRQVVTAVFPDKALIDGLLERGLEDVLLFCHHAMGYDGAAEGFPFYDIPREQVGRMRARRMALYVLHAPLDRNGPWSTATRLAEAMELEPVEEFCEWGGARVGLVCRTAAKTCEELAEKVRQRVGHPVKLRRYGEERIRNGLVGVVAGGGSYDFVAAELAEKGINLCLTGFTRPLPTFEPVVGFHRIAREKGLNVLGAGHYTTEKYACQGMCGYFRSLGLPAEFQEGRCWPEDL